MINESRQTQDSTPTLPERFLRGLAISPGKEAIRLPERSLTYEEAHELALLWAGSLLRAFEDPPRAIGVLAGKGLESYIGVLAALYCGVPAVPLQPDFPAYRTRSMLRAAGVSAIVADDRGCRLLPELPETAGVPVLAPAADAAPPGQPAIPVRPGFAVPEPRRADPGEAAYILFTSGSTGRPKGVVITHANLGHYFAELQARYRFGPDDVFSQVFDPAFDCAISDLFAAWGAGAALVSVPAAAYRSMTDFITAAGITVWYSTPATISVVARRGGLAPNSLPSLRLSTFAGDALMAADAAAWQAAGPQGIIDNLYGPAETTITCTVYRWAPGTSPGESLNGIAPIGRLHGGHEYLLLDSQGTETGAEGELWISGPQVTPGYLDPGDDHGRFLVRGGRRWYRTGDRMRRADNGDLLFLGRTDNQVQVQGWRTELAEIDHRMRAIAGVRDAVTVATVVEGTPRLVVFYTGTPLPARQLSRQLMTVLPQQMIPRHFEHLDELPLSANRKVDRRAMRERAAKLIGGRETAGHPKAEVRP